MSNAVKDIAKYIRKNPDEKAASDLRDLCIALESSATFNLGCLYELDRKPFELAMRLLEEWRFDRHVFERRLYKYLAEPDDEA